MCARRLACELKLDVSWRLCRAHLARAHAVSSLQAGKDCKSHAHPAHAHTFSFDSQHCCACLRDARALAMRFIDR
eukprot:348582-Pleurochrysis_carterae.AAC.6